MFVTAYRPGVLHRGKTRKLYPFETRSSSLTITTPWLDCEEKKNKVMSWGRKKNTAKMTVLFFFILWGYWYRWPFFFAPGNHSTARLVITLSRELRSHLLESYLPSTLFVIMSWGSFVVMPEVVPGRMVLLVTTLLSLVTMFDNIRYVTFFVFVTSSTPRLREFTEKIKIKF